MKYTSNTIEAFKRGAKLARARISEGGHPMIPYYYRKKYGKRVKPTRALRRSINYATKGLK